MFLGGMFVLVDAADRRFYALEVFKWKLFLYEPAVMMN